MIKHFEHKGLEVFFNSGSKAGIQPIHATRLQMQLFRLNAAKSPEDMNAPNWKLHPLKGKLQGCWAVWVDKNWRLVFAFEEGDAVLVNYQDYH